MRLLSPRLNVVHMLLQSQRHGLCRDRGRLAVWHAGAALRVQLLSSTHRHTSKRRGLRHQWARGMSEDSRGFGSRHGNIQDSPRNGMDL